MILAQVDNFVYLGGNINSSTGRDIDRRVGLVSSNLSAATSNVWTSKDISKATKLKLKVYETVIFSTLLYNSKTRTLRWHNRID